VSLFPGRCSSVHVDGFRAPERNTHLLVIDGIRTIFIKGSKDLFELFFLSRPSSGLCEARGQILRG